MLQEQYKSKLMTAAQAVSRVKSGDWIEFGFFANLPLVLDAALAARMNELKDIKLKGGVLMAPLKTLAHDEAIFHGYHFGGMERKLSQENKAFHTPQKYAELPRYIRENQTTDVVMVQTGPMDQHGYFNFGVTFSHFKAAADMARTVIVEINEDLPRVHGGYETGLHISEIDCIVEGGKNGVFTLPSAEPSDIDKKIAGYVLSELTDGACIQLGIGGMPNALGLMIAQSDLKDLGIHSEMLADSFVDMVEAGKVTGKKKQIDIGRIVFTFAAGSQKLYDFMDDNPMLAAYPVDYTNDPMIIAKNDNVISINGALELDITGQVCSESVGYKQFSGTGGQMDFVEGSYRSRGGKSFLCLPATYKGKNGELLSKIKPELTAGSIVTTPRTFAQYIVTEFGKVNIKGVSTWERAERLISISHPDFRDSMIKDAEKMNIWRRSNKK